MFEQRPSGLYTPTREVIAPELEQLLERERRPGELPPLAGGAPFWVLSLPQFFSAFPNEARVANTTVTFESPNLLQVDAPTVMTEWELTSINIFAVTEYGETGAGGVANTQQLSAQLLVGGDVVWQAAAEQAGQHFTGVPKLTGQTWRLSADLNNPIPLPRGRTLRLRMASAVTLETENAKIIVGGNPPIGTLGVSTIAYTVRRLTGHRTL